MRAVRIVLRRPAGEQSIQPASRSETSPSQGTSQSTVTPCWPEDRLQRAGLNFQPTFLPQARAALRGSQKFRRPASLPRAPFDKRKKSDLLCWRSRPHHFSELSDSAPIEGRWAQWTIRCGLLTMTRTAPARSLEIRPVYGTIPEGENNAARTRSNQFQPA